jgi:glucose-6-phosphate 1-dehydrogenase
MRSLSLLMLCILSLAIYSQNNLIIISEEAIPFQLHLNSTLINPKEESIVKAYSLTETYYGVKININNQEYNIENQLYLLQKGKPCEKKEFTYALVPYKKTYSLVFLGTAPVGRDSLFPKHLQFTKPVTSKKDSTPLAVEMLIDDIQYDDTARCYMMLPENIFNKVKTETSKERFEDVKLRLIKEIFPGYCIRTDQLAVLCNNLKFEISRLNLMKDVYRFISDKENAVELKKLLRFEAAREEWIQFVQKTK